MTVFSNAEEAINEMEWGGKLAFLAQTALADAGGVMQERTTLYMPNAVRDLSASSVLVTGQNPFSAPDVAAMLLDELVVLCGA